MQRTPPGGRGRGSVPPSSRPQSASGSANRPPSQPPFRPPHPRNNPQPPRANAALPFFSFFFLSTQNNLARISPKLFQVWLTL
ncbi:hypothetical protein CROQUDRAFT_652016 [Cronartium quercuum f. sp. fusiforme G11]|uniref:Uncharacterized protein n=1 Tax=Cronartium quercuum f. sp. fusiforme G11 TaxID=708437 RepID=A0A9P6THH1_9BASI|nr:hypothetical protein CROQUDRAFT_652016 [Cronartium quercuum f. sp. fusiforme G11]